MHKEVNVRDDQVNETKFRETGFRGGFEQGRKAHGK